MSAANPEMTKRSCPCAENCSGCAPHEPGEPCGREHMSAACDGCPACIRAGADAFWATMGTVTPATPDRPDASRARNPFASTV